MNAPITSTFDLPDRLVVKADPTRIAADVAHFAAVADSLAATIVELSARLAAERLASGRSGQAALERDQQIHRLAARLRTLRRFGVDLCLGRMSFADQGRPVYVGRLGLTDSAGRRLLLDWRSPAAEPFFAATAANPMGLTSRRRYRWTAGRVTDYWDEVLIPTAVDPSVAPDDESALLAGLAASRTARMRDVLTTIQADQDAVIRAGSSGALVVDGGPGTGKTVVALHRAAYLLYADPRLGHRRGGVLFVGPHRAYLDYVADVLPSLGEDGVQTCTVAELVPEGDAATTETSVEVARLKSDAALVRAVDRAVAFYEQPPDTSTTVATEWVDVQLTPGDWAEAFAAGTALPHNEAREMIRTELVELLVAKIGAGLPDDVAAEVPHDVLRREVRRNRGLHAAIDRAWPMLDATDVIGDLWSVPAYLRYCAPHLQGSEVQRLQREQPDSWTFADLPLLDAARRRLGDRAAADRQRRHDAAVRARAEAMTRVVDDLIAGDDSELQVMSMLRGDDLRTTLDDDGTSPAADSDSLAGPFAHVIVDEAQELTDAEWQMLLARCPTGSVTVVGDRAQARAGFPESWRERLQRVGLGRISVATLAINYRTPAEVMAAAAPVIRAALPDANVPVSIRDRGLPVRYGATADLDDVVDRWLDEHAEGTVCVIGAPGFSRPARARSLSPVLAKGLEFDLVVVVDPQRFGDGVAGAVDRYVAMTRATSELVVLTS